jgi:hypothetical protein
MSIISADVCKSSFLYVDVQLYVYPVHFVTWPFITSNLLREVWSQAEWCWFLLRILGDIKWVLQKLANEIRAEKVMLHGIFCGSRVGVQQSVVGICSSVRMWESAFCPCYCIGCGSSSWFTVLYDGRVNIVTWQSVACAYVGREIYLKVCDTAGRRDSAITRAVLFQLAVWIYLIIDRRWVSQ